MANRVTTEIDLGLTRREDVIRKAILVLTTAKSYKGGIVSMARVHWAPESGPASYAVEDFSRRINHDEHARASQAAIDRQHNFVFPPRVVASLTAEAKAHYVEKPPAADISIDWDDPVARLHLINRIGIDAYNKALTAHLEANPIRPVTTRFGTLYTAGSTGKAFHTRDEAERFLKEAR